jgi:hypothetical protein
LKILLSQSEIKLAIEAAIKAKINISNSQELVIDIIVSRNPTSHSAEIDIVDRELPKEVPHPVAVNRTQSSAPFETEHAALTNEPEAVELPKRSMGDILNLG